MTEFRIFGRIAYHKVGLAFSFYLLSPWIIYLLCMCRLHGTVASWMGRLSSFPEMFTVLFNAGCQRYLLTSPCVEGSHSGRVVSSWSF